jgi:hypothetical protein
VEKYYYLCRVKKEIMTFNNITKDTTCNCFDGTVEDTVSTFARVIKNEKITDFDFRSYWEQNRRSSDCSEVCLLKGVSVSKINNDIIKNEKINYYKAIRKVSPKYKSGILFFKLKDDAGVCKSTPSRDNPQHNTIYKSDGFELNLVVEIETCYLNQ